MTRVTGPQGQLGLAPWALDKATMPHVPVTKKGVCVCPSGSRAGTLG